MCDRILLFCLRNQDGLLLSLEKRGQELGMKIPLGLQPIVCCLSGLNVTTRSSVVSTLKVGTHDIGKNQKVDKLVQLDGQP